MSAEMTVEKRYLKGNGDSTFTKTGKTTYPVLLIRDDAINFSDMWLEQEEPDIDISNEILIS